MSSVKTGVKTGSELIAEERLRQIEIEGWTPEHDDEHGSCELNRAASCYLAAARSFSSLLTGGIPGFSWPWGPQWWKPSIDPIRNLVKAGALIAAEIDRLNRAT